MMKNLPFSSSSITFVGFLLVSSILAQAPEPQWDNETKGRFYLRLREAWNLFTNNWPKDEAQKTRASADGPQTTNADNAAFFHLPKERVFNLSTIGTWSSDFVNRVRTAVDRCEVYMDYDYRVDDSGKIYLLRSGFVKDPIEGKYSLYTARWEARCDLGTVGNKRFLSCIFGEIAKQGDPKKCATSDFPASAAENFQKCAISRATAYFMQDVQVNWDLIQKGVKEFGQYVSHYDPLPKCPFGYSVPRPFDGACPKNDNQAWFGCGVTPTPSGAPLKITFSSLGLLLSTLVYLAKSMI